MTIMRAKDVPDTGVPRAQSGHDGPEPPAVAPVDRGRPLLHGGPGERPGPDQGAVRAGPPWLAAAEASVVRGTEKPRVSTCFLIDDYFQRSHDAADIMRSCCSSPPRPACRIDYSPGNPPAPAAPTACASPNSWPAACCRSPSRRPPPARARPRCARAGWPTARPPRDGKVLAAMQGHDWERPVEFSKRNHSIFLDVELWKDFADPGDDEEVILSRRHYSCPFLASVWQLVAARPAAQATARRRCGHRPRPSRPRRLRPSSPTSSR